MTTTSVAAWTKRNVKIIPSLIAGVGGTGVSVIRNLKRRVRLEWPGVFAGDMPALIQFYGIDSVSYTNRPDQEFLSPGEYGFIGGFDPQDLIAPTGPYQSVRSWWTFPPDMLPAGMIHLGARQIRPLGRLALFYAFPEIWQNIQYKIDVLNQIASDNQATRYGYGFPVETSARQVIIVSSICGGTGAGCFLDIAARIRDRMATQVKIIGVFVLPSAFEQILLSREQIERTRANAFAAIKEIDHFWYGNKDVFSVQFPGESQPMLQRHALFDEVYLIGREGRGRSLSTLEDVTQQIAHFLYLTSINNLADPVGERLVNLSRVEPYYTSFAVGALSLPDRKLSDSLLADLKRRYLLSLVQDNRNQTHEEDLINTITEFLEEQKRIARAEGDRLINAPPEDFNHRSQMFREQVVMRTLRWTFGTLVPTYGLNAVIDAYDELENEYAAIQEDITNQEQDVDEARTRMDRRGVLDRLGRFGQFIAGLLRLKTSDQYIETIDNTRKELAVLQMLAPSDDRRSGKRLLSFVLDTLEPLARRVAAFQNQAERIAAQLGTEQRQALQRPSDTPSRRGDGREYRYYDLEIDPTLRGPTNAFESLVSDVINDERLHEFIAAPRVLIPQPTVGVRDGVTPPATLQLLGLYDTGVGSRRSGHLTDIAEVARFINRDYVLNLIEREDWEIDSMAEEFVVTKVDEQLRKSAGLMAFFAQPLGQSQERRSAMTEGLRTITKLMMDHVKPFWGVRPFPDERQLEQIRYICLAEDPNTNDISRDILREYSPPFQYVRGGDPYRMDALLIEHGARPQHVAELHLCKQAYLALKARNAHTALHLNPDYAQFSDPL